MVSRKYTITEIITLYRKLKRHFPESLLNNYKMPYNFEQLKDIKPSKYFLFDGSNFYQANDLRKLPLIKKKEEGEDNNGDEFDTFDDQFSDIFHANDDEVEQTTDQNESSNEINKDDNFNRNLPNSIQINPIKESTIKHKPKFWLNIFQPTKDDIDYLYNEYSIHPTSLSDILESNTDVKIDLYSDYTFISLALLTSTQEKDIDLNIMIFNNCIITTHNNYWTGMNDIVNFLFLVTQYTKFRTHWVVFSILVEVLQDIKFKTDIIEETILLEKNKNKRINIIPSTQNTKNSLIKRNLLARMNGDSIINIDSSSEDFGLNYEAYKEKTDSNLKYNFKLSNKVSNLLSYLKLKKNILKEIIKNTIQKRKNEKQAKTKHINNLMSYYFALLTEDFSTAEDILKDIQRSLERQQDLLLALLDIKQSTEANEMSRAINRFALVTFIFLPCQTIAGLWGMNVKVPFQGGSEIPFYVLTILGFLSSLLLMFVINKKNGGTKIKKSV